MYFIFLCLARVEKGKLFLLLDSENKSFKVWNLTMFANCLEIDTPLIVWLDLRGVYYSLLLTYWLV